MENKLLKDEKDRLMKTIRVTNNAINLGSAELERIDGKTKDANNNLLSLETIIDNKNKDILLLEGELLKRKKEIIDFNNDYKNRKNELSDVIKKLEDKKNELSLMEDNFKKEFQQNKKFQEKEITVLQSQKEELVNEIASSENFNNNLKEELDGLIGKKKSLSADIEADKVEKKELEDRLEQSSIKLENVIGSIIGYQNKIDALKFTLKKLSDEISEKENERTLILKNFKEVVSENEKAKQELDTVLLRTRALVEREDHVLGQEIYLKSLFKKIGHEYEPFRE